MLLEKADGDWGQIEMEEIAPCLEFSIDVGREMVYFKSWCNPLTLESQHEVKIDVLFSTTVI